MLSCVITQFSSELGEGGSILNSPAHVLSLDPTHAFYDGKDGGRGSGGGM